MSDLAALPRRRSKVSRRRTAGNGVEVRAFRPLIIDGDHASDPRFDCPAGRGTFPNTGPGDACFSATGSSREPDDFSLSIVGRRDVADADRGARGGTSGVCGYDREELPAPGYSLEVVDASIFEPDS